MNELEEICEKISTACGYTLGYTHDDYKTCRELVLGEDLLKYKLEDIMKEGYIENVEDALDFYNDLRIDIIKMLVKFVSDKEIPLDDRWAALLKLGDITVDYQQNPQILNSNFLWYKKEGIYNDREINAKKEIVMSNFIDQYKE